MIKDIFIIGSGPSLQNLTFEETDYINTCETISVNRYPIFTDYIGIKAKSNIYIDNNYKTPHILRELIKAKKDLKLETDYYFSSNITDGCTDRQYVFESRMDILGDFEFKRLEKSKTITFANTIDEPFYMRTTLGAAINLACVLYGNDVNIKILGADGGGNKHFFTNIVKFLKSRNLVDQSFINANQEGFEKSKHPAEAFQNFIENDFPKIENRSKNLFICNQKSTLFKNIFSYSPIIPVS